MFRIRSGLVFLALSASPVSAATFLTDFSVQTLGNYTTNGGNKIGTGIAVAGNARINSDQVGTRLTSANDNLAAVIVGGNLAYDNSKLNHGSVVYGGANTSGKWTQVKTPNGTVTQGQPLDFTPFDSYYQSLSTTLAGQDTTGSFSILNGAGTLTASQPGLNIFHLTGKDLAAIHNLSFKGDKGTQLIINVDAASVGNHINFKFGSLGAEDVLFNFYNATDLALNWKLPGSILAPNASMTLNGGSYGGSIVTRDMTLNGGTTIEGNTSIELDRFVQMGGITVPEPATWGMLLGGFALIGWKIRRRKKIENVFA